MAFPLAATAQPVPADAPVKTLGVVTVTGGQPTSLPTQIPTTMEGITREQIDRTINATDSEDVLKYFPSLLVRKRYVGDYNHAILSSRASGTGNSARSLVYADGILLSNFLGNGVGGLGYVPRWGMVTPAEIERVDVMYGPFSAAYPGNSAGAVVEYVTRMPRRFEAHASVGLSSQPFELYGTRDTFRAWQTSASLGNRSGDWSWWLNVHRTDSQSPPQTFATRLRSAGVPGPAGTAVDGAVAGSSNANAPWYVVGSGTQYHTRQDHIKARVAYDFSAAMRASYVVGWWNNRSYAGARSYLTNAGSGATVSSGGVNIGGLAYTGAQALRGSDFALGREELTHFMHGLSLKTNTRGTWDWEISASLYDYHRDERRQSGAANTLPGAAMGGAGTVADGAGSGWNTLSVRGTWRPAGMKGEHIVDFGAQQESYTLRHLSSAIAGNWITDPPGAVASAVGGRTRLRSLWGQDSWAFAPGWRAVLGARLEHWTAHEGYTRIPGATPAVNAAWAARSQSFLSPKAALSYQWSPVTVIKASAGRAVRMPTVGELYGATSTTNSRYINDPDLAPEKSWTAELGVERDLGHGIVRLTGFAEDTRDALYVQTAFDPAALANVSRVRNVDHILTTGMELAYTGSDVGVRGLDLLGSLTYADSIIRRNTGFVAVPGDTAGKRQPNVAQWRATAQASWRFDRHWTGAVSARYSGPQHRTLNNADVNGATYMGVSSFLVVDMRLRWQLDRQWSAALGIDNLNNDRHWNFHPYPQRSYSLELKFDL